MYGIAFARTRYFVKSGLPVMRELKFECQSSTEVLEKLDVFAIGIGALEDAQKVQRSAKRRGCLLSYSRAEPGRKLTQPSPSLLAEPCM